MAIDRKEYRADKKAYKANKKQGKAGKKDAKKADLQSKRNSRKTGESRQYHGYVQIDKEKPKRSDYKKSETAVGDGPTPRVPSAKATGSTASTARMKSMYAKVMQPLPTPMVQALPTPPSMSKNLPRKITPIKDIETPLIKPIDTQFFNQQQHAANKQAKLNAQKGFK